MKEVQCSLQNSIGLAILTFNVKGVIYRYTTWNMALAKDIRRMSERKGYRSLNKAKKYTQRVA